MLKKNDLIELRITDITHEGQGVGRHEGMAVFVPGAATGDLLRVRVVKVLASHCFGILDEILEPSPHRIPADCPVYRQCGGCSLRHITYRHECEVKNNWVYQNLSRIGGVDIPPVPLLPSPQVDGYRNKAQYPLEETDSGLAIGFYAPRSHRVVPATHCLLQPQEFADILEAVREFLLAHKISIYDEASHRGLLRHIYLRRGEVSGQVMLCLVVNGTGLPHSDKLAEMVRTRFPQVSSLLLNLNRERTNVILGRENILLFGEEFITDTLCEVEVSLSPLAFYQVNRASAEQLYRVAAEFAELSPQDVLLDLYCGAGTIGLSMASQVKEVIGVEVIPQAVENARQNAAQNGIENARFLCADASAAAKQLAEEGLRPSVVVVDPPRKGCDQAVLSAIETMAPERLVYISCNSATLARDVKILGECGYEVKRVQAVDLFPRTAHVEVVVLLQKKSV